MNTQNRSYAYLVIWIVALLFIGGLIGSLTKTEINTWYLTLSRSPLTPPNYVFPIAWSLLYAMIACVGWLIWRAQSSSHLRLVKALYLFQLVLNWLWTPLFFRYHLTGLSLINLLVMDISVAMIIYLCRSNLREVSILLAPYLVWILFATYLNFYIWQHNF